VVVSAFEVCGSLNA